MEIEKSKKIKHHKDNHFSQGGQGIQEDASNEENEEKRVKRFEDLPGFNFDPNIPQNSKIKKAEVSAVRLPTLI